MNGEIRGIWRMKGKDEKILWIDCIKAIAILAVLVDHTFMVLYDNPNIQTATFFSVSLFILVMGITTWISEENHSKEEVGTRVRRRIKKIIIPYIVATFIYSVFQDRYFNFELFINRVVLFNASGPLYYVALYIQLIVINIFLYTIIKKCNQCKYSCLYKTIIFIFLLFGASLSINYSNILNIYGGGGKLFGGTYAVLSYLGMILAPWMLGEKGKLYLVNLSGVSSILWALWMGFIWKDHFHIDTYFPLGGGY